MPPKAGEVERVKAFGAGSRRFIEPPLVTTHQVKTFKEATAKELLFTHAEANKTVNGAKHLHRNNSYFGYFRQPTEDPIWPEHKFTIDQIKDTTTYEPKIPRDTFHPQHTEATRKRINARLSTQWQIRTSQSYGWLPPIDDPKMGFGRSSIFMDSSMDKSHLGAGKG
eukprot:TRINITY_DN103977_c0_g1_i1.p1 TRINITY_DN103977_c0_g1~~TRINITY_DN103977_c0_g1_i1.p1  ORF type:complete len:167 (+),score=36.27 TRINITY_DN103977_c0_g1_i1:116-616(+)